MHRLLYPITFATLILLHPVSGVSDTLSMPDQPVQAAEPTLSITLPGRGMTMTEVESKFGLPQQKYPEVGDPPITRWVYGNFSVYFEYQYVIHAVAQTGGMPVPPPMPAPMPAAEEAAPETAEAVSEAPVEVEQPPVMPTQ